MKESTRQHKRRQAHQQQWALIVAYGASGELSKAEVARRVGCCRQTVYNVQAKARGLPAGEAPLPGKPGPPVGSGLRTAPEQLKLVVAYRQQHPDRGYHYCYHDLRRQGLQPPAAATIGRAWRRAGLMTASARPPRPPTRWVPPRPQRPGHVQVDAKYLPAGRFEFTALDVYSRHVYARVHCALTADSAQAFLNGLLAEVPFSVHTIQVDGGGEFKAEFDKLLLERGLQRRQNDPHSPWQNGFVERFHRTVAEECYLALPGELSERSTAELQLALAAYLETYNNQRLHSSLGYRPPSELLATVAEPVYPKFTKRCPTNP